MRKRQVSLSEEVAQFKRQLILDVAARLFYERGYSGTSMEAIAEELQATKPFVYYHFASKAEILSKVCGSTIEDVAILAEQVLARKDTAQQRLVDLVSALTVRVIERQVHLSVYFREETYLEEAAFRQLKRNRRRFENALAELLRQGSERGEFSVPQPKFTARAIAGMITWLFTWYRSNGPSSAEEIAAEMVVLANRMVGAVGKRT